jgi:hypothetical protein
VADVTGLLPEPGNQAAADYPVLTSRHCRYWSITRGARARYSSGAVAVVFRSLAAATKFHTAAERMRKMQHDQNLPLARTDAAPRRDDASAGYWLSFNMHGTIVYCTEQLALLCGRDITQMQGAPAASLLPQLPLDGNSARQKVAAMMDYVYGCHQLQLALADGRTMPVEAAITSVLVDKGPLFNVVLRYAGREAEQGRARENR